MMGPRAFTCKVLIAGFAFIAVGPSQVSAADFYAGKTITIFASSEPGGGYDTYARLLGRYLPKYIPGTPSVIVKNVVGGGGVRAVQQLYALSPNDGTTIGNLRASSLLDSILGLRAAELVPIKFNFIGSMASDTDLCSFWYTAGISTFDDLRQKEVIVGASGKGAQNYSFANAMNRVLGTKMRIILGYQGMSDRIIALERGELQGNCGINSSSIASLRMPLVESGKLLPIVQSGLRPYPTFPLVPLTQSFASNERDRRLLTALFSQMEIARVFAAPPGTPKDRVETLRRAFDKALSDPDLLVEAKKINIDISPTDGEHTEKIVNDMSNIPLDLKAELRSIVGE
jgi:tripartite-type tricarboxylate transporter receptor subunit TctC